MKSRSWRPRWAKPARVRPVARCSRSSSTSRDPVAGADRVDRHPDLHPVAGGEREHVAERGGAHRPLARDRRGRLEAAEPLDRPARVALGEAEAAADLALEGGDREIALAVLDRLEQREQAGGGLAEVAVAEQDGRVARRGRRARRSQAAVMLPPLPCGRLRPITVAPAASATSRVPSSEASSATKRRRGPGRRASAPRSSRRSGRPRCARRRRRRGGARSPLSASIGDYSRAVADIPAHITGTVWKIEVAVGDQVDEGDDVVILESMKMEMPVEAEDSGKVSEIRCEEGQSVAEGDVLVVLE